MIYTSGSTGRPKGVMISHRALSNFIVSMGKTPGFTRNDSLLAVTTYCFDIVGLELYLPLTRGGKVMICPEETARDGLKLKKAIEAFRPTMIQATPSTFLMLFHAGWKNSEKVKILVGGEPLSQDLKQRFDHTRSEVWNMYGPTETTIWSTVEKLEPERPITIGRPIANTEVYIVDPRMNLLPAGIPGELCIAGHGVAEGYWHRLDLTARQFVDNPFDHLTGTKGTKLYRTGDLARWLEDGRLFHMGRMDLQVKIRGFRVELGEVETHLNGHAGIREAVVVARKQEGGSQLAAFYVPREKGRHPDPGTLKKYLAPRLPRYMVPAFFMALTEIPLTPNGKTDRKRLMAMELSIHSPEKALQKKIGPGKEIGPDKEVGAKKAIGFDKEIGPAQTETGPAQTKNHGDPVALEEIRRKITAIWQEVLEVTDLRPNDAFFDAGGNSVLAVIAAGRIAEAF